MPKCSEHLPWDDYFMAVAFLAAKRSKDPKTKVGACIVNKKNIIVGIGYNGMPKGCSDDVYPWDKSDDIFHNKLTYVCHAEMNAILNKNCADIDDCKMYVSLFPCNVCAKFIIQSGIKEIVYVSNKNEGRPENQAAQRMFTSANVTYTQHIPKEKIVIDFNTLPLSPEKRKQRDQTTQANDAEEQANGSTAAQTSDESLVCAKVSRLS